jgi:glycine cleavage system H protein
MAEEETVPEELHYTKEHEWVRVEGDLAIVGITDHAQDAMGDITYVDPPAVGVRVKQFGELGSIDSAKAASDIYAPLAGVVAEVNEALEDAPETINSDPYGAGWICKLNEIDASGLDKLLTAQGYRELLEEEEA